MARTNLSELREEMRALARGDRQPAALPAAPLLAALSREALDLLGAILRERPATIAALVSLTGRAQPNVSRCSSSSRGMDLFGSSERDGKSGLCRSFAKCESI